MSTPPAANGHAPAFQIAFHTATPHGVVSAVHLPEGSDPVPEHVLEQLPEVEREHARTLRAFRQVQFVGGRLALRAARSQLGAPLGAVLSTPRGAPAMPPGWVGSVSHKRTIAVAMVARPHDGTVGVDIEDRLPARMSIAERILRPAELADLPADPHLAWQGLVLRFSIKESIYKALDPFVNRYVGFHEAEVTPGLDGTAAASLHLAHGEGPFIVDARYRWLPGRLLTSVRIRPG